MSLTWNKSTEDNFKKMIGKIPVFVRGIAQEKVFKKAESLAVKDNRAEVTEKDLVDAFFSETPFGFHGPLKRDMEEFKIDYTQYGYER